MTLSAARAVLDGTLSEKQWQAQVLAYARLRGWLCYHTYDARRSAPGFPDLVMVRDGRVVFAELKAGKRPRLSADQQVWQARLVEAMARADEVVQMYVWMPKDWPAVREALS